MHNTTHEAPSNARSSIKNSPFFELLLFAGEPSQFREPTSRCHSHRHEALPNARSFLQNRPIFDVFVLQESLSNLGSLQVAAIHTGAKYPSTNERASVHKGNEFPFQINFPCCHSHRCEWQVAIHTVSLEHNSPFICWRVFCKRPFNKLSFAKDPDEVSLLDIVWHPTWIPESINSPFICWRVFCKRHLMRYRY